MKKPYLITLAWVIITGENSTFVHFIFRPTYFRLSLCSASFFYAVASLIKKVDLTRFSSFDSSFQSF